MNCRLTAWALGQLRNELAALRQAQASERSGRGAARGARRPAISGKFRAARRPVPVTGGGAA